MVQHFKALKITDKVYWVGAIDWQVRDFHGYATKQGTTYNAFLILADKITLIDTVKATYKEEFFARIQSIINLKDIDIIISNHSEMDHSGLLQETIALTNPEKVYTSKMGVKNLIAHFPQLEDKLQAVNDGEILSLGNMSIKTIETRMLHWPDSMASYLQEEEILFSNDIFGSHFATNERFDDQVNKATLDYEAAKYFANIFMPYCSSVSKTMKRFEEEKLTYKLIAPDHGPIWKNHIDEIITKYQEWPKLKPAKKAVITFDTMWGSTARMAKAISEGLASEEIEVKLMPINGSHRSDVATELLEAGIFVVGSPVLNNNIFPTVADVMTYLKGLGPKNLVCSTFGSYGWSPAPLYKLDTILTEDMKMNIDAEAVRVQYVPKEEELQKCFNLGVELAGKLKEELNR
jgi:flavorubredoxin